MQGILPEIHACQMIVVICLISPWFQGSNHFHIHSSGPHPTSYIISILLTIDISLTTNSILSSSYTMFCTWNYRNIRTLNLEENSKIIYVCSAFPFQNQLGMYHANVEQSALLGKNNKPWFKAFDNFCSVNTFPMASFKLPTWWLHWVWCHFHHADIIHLNDLKSLANSKILTSDEFCTFIAFVF